MDTKRGKRFKQTNIIAGLLYSLDCKKHIAVHSYAHATNSHFFEDWFEFELIPLLLYNTVVIMDNASFHRKNHLYDIAKRYGINLLFLPTYSPDFNLIEKTWANFKRWLCDNLKRFPNLDWAIECYLTP